MSSYHLLFIFKDKKASVEYYRAVPGAEIVTSIVEGCK